MPKTTFFKGGFLIPRDNLMQQKHWQRILVHDGLSSHFLAVSFLSALPWLDGFHYVTSRVPAYKEVKDVWKCVRYCILLPRNSTRFSSPLSACDTCYRLFSIDARYCLRSNSYVWLDIKIYIKFKMILSKNCHIFRSL